MSRKNFTWIIIIVLIILGIAAWWFFSHENGARAPEAPAPSGQNLFPFGQNKVETPASQNSPATNSPTVINESSPTGTTLIQISKTPVAGYGFLPESTTSLPTVRYIDRGTGHIYEYSMDTGMNLEITNTTMPKIYEGFFSKDGSRVIFRSLDDNRNIVTVSAKISTTTSSLRDITFFPKNISSVALGPSNALFYLQKLSSGSVGYTSALDGTNKKQIFSSPLRELTASWPSSVNIFLETAPSASVGGFAFGLNQKTGILTLIIRNVRGLRAIENPTGDFVFTGSLIYDIKKNTARSVPLSTLADKCVWSKKNSNEIYCAVPSAFSGTMPDDWYQGNVFLANNNIWKIMASTGETDVVDFLSSKNPDMDATYLSLNQSEKWLLFVNKEDLMLWALNLSK